MTRRARVFAWASLVAALALTAVGGWLHAIGGAPVSYAWGFPGYEALLAVVFTLAGGIVATRRPTNPVGWIFCLLGLGSALQYLTAQYSLRAIVTAPGSLPAARYAGWVQDWVWIPLIGLVGLLFLLFPHERFATRASRRVAVAGTAAFAATLLSRAFLPPRLDSFDLDNPLGLLADREVAEGIFGLCALAMMLSIAAAALLLLERFRRATGVERQQLKWFVFASAIASVGLVAGIAPPIRSLGSYVAVAGLALVPVATGIAVLKYRLYEIDRIINTTLVYGTLTASLALAYFVGVTVLQRLLQPITGTSSIAVAGSTLGVAALFGPLRRRIQNFIDRRFYRRRYDAAKTLGAFAATLRAEIDVDAVARELLAVTSDITQPAHASVWLRPRHPGPDR